MRTHRNGAGAAATKRARTQQGGATLIELVVFVAVVALALGALLGVYRFSITHSVDPLVRARLLEAAQSQLDVVMAQPYDVATPPGGVPACGSVVAAGQPEAAPCSGAGGVSDFDGYSDSPYVGYSRSVSVALAGVELGLADNEYAKRISVTTTAPSGESLTLTAYRANF